MNISIEGSVGQGDRSKNNPVDVAVIQKMLKIFFTQRAKTKGRSTSVVSPPINVDGLYTVKLNAHIKKFQTTICGMKHPDGRIDPKGGTLRKLTAQFKSAVKTPKQFLFGATAPNTGVLTKVDPKRLRQFFIKQAGLGLTITKGEDFLGFFKYLQNDPDIKDIRWAAYILATAHHETTFSFKANKGETGNGKKYQYGKLKSVKDTIGCRGPINVVYHNAYYGRGYTQLTHPDNYKSVGKAYGIGDELYINPDKVNEPDISYFAISQGLIRGLFTKHKLSDHINGQKCDYVNARRIVNGTDKCHIIAERAEKIEIILRLSVAASTMVLNDHLFHFC